VAEPPAPWAEAAGPGLAADAPAPVAVQRAGARSQGVGSDSFGTARSSYHKETYYQIQKK